MDALTDDVAELDGPLLAALWVRAVLAADPAVVARCESECERRGTTARALVGAAKKKKDDDSGAIQTVGERRAGPHNYQDIITQAQKNQREGKSWDTGQATYQTKGYNPYRKKKGEKGGGQFASKGDSAAETTDPDAARPGAELQEDDKRIPKKSPGGADIDDFRDGMMIYEDGTRFDGKGWRNAKGQALDANGNVVRKPKKGKGGGTVDKAARDAETAKKQAARDASTAWDSAENRRKAEEAATKGDYAALLSIATRTEREARKSRDLAEAGADRAALDKAVETAQADLARIRDDAEQANTAKETASKAKRETDAAARTTERETRATAEYAEIAANYPTWEKELRDQYADVGLSETELAELVIRDRARRVRLLPRKRAVTAAAAGFDGAVLALLVAGDDTHTYDDGDAAPLHCTICFLGPASELDAHQQQRCLDMARNIGEDFAPFDAQVVSPAQFGDTPVGLLEHPALTRIRDTALADPTIGELRDANDEHPGYLPHVSGLDDRDRVRFDRVAAMLGGDVTEFPLTGSLAASLIAALTAAYDPAMHPKGKDGKWIEKLGLVDVFGLSGFQHGQRGASQVQGQVTEIIPDPSKPGDPVIRITLTDPRWDPAKFGPTVDVRRSQVAQRTTPKATLPKKAPAPDFAAAKPQIADSGLPPVRSPLPALTPHPDGPHLTPIELPADWQTMDPPARLGFLKDRMDADFTKWRGEPTSFDFTGFDSGIAFNVANTYRDLANWDPDTARRIDNPILPSSGGSNGLGANAIAVAHPGTAHPGGIGEKVKPSAIVFGTKYVSSMKFWAGQKAANQNAAVPFSTSSVTGDPTVTLVHEFGHHRQFRYLDVAMRDADKAWTDGVRDDGFGLIPDTSNWPETQALRYQIPKLSHTKYGQSKSSEGFAEGVAERALGTSSPELNDTFDEWEMYMGMATQFPPDRLWDTRSFDELNPAEQDQWWTTNGPYLELAGMRDHYPDSAAAYDAWLAGKPSPEPTGQSGLTTKAADWEDDALQNVPVSVAGPGGAIPLTTLSDDTGQFEPGGWADPATITSVQDGLDRVNASYPQAPPLRTIGIRPDQTALGNKSIDTITVSPGFHDPAVWAQKQKDSWLFAGDGTPAATIFHEYGHILDGALTSEQRQPLDAIVRAPVTYQVNGTDVTAPRWQSGDTSMKNPSAYASESPYEFVAEALTDVEFNGDEAAPISHEIAAIFAEVFG